MHSTKNNEALSIHLIIFLFFKTVALFRTHELKKNPVCLKFEMNFEISLVSWQRKLKKCRLREKRISGIGGVSAEDRSGGEANKTTTSPF